MQIQILNSKQCRSRSVGFFRSQLIWIYTVCKGRPDPGSAGQGLMVNLDHEIISTVILFRPLTQEGQLSVTGDSMCTSTG